MPQDYIAMNPQTGESVRWDGKAWIPVPKPSAINRGVTSLTGVPEGTNIDPTSKEFYKGSGDLGNWINAIKQAASGLNPLPAMKESEATAEQRFSKPGWENKVTGAEEFLESG